MNTRTPARPSPYSMHPCFERMGSSASKDAQDYDPAALVASMFGGPKEALRPLYERLLKIGLAIGDAEATERLIVTGGLAKGDRITHRIPIAAASDIDDEVRRWLKVAYDLDSSEQVFLARGKHAR